MACMVWNLLCTLEMLFFSHKPKIWWNSDTWKNFSKIFSFFDFGVCFTTFAENQLFWGWALPYGVDVCTYFGMYGWKEVTHDSWCKLDIGLWKNGDNW